MAHVAKIEDNIVTEVHVINNKDLPDNGSFNSIVEEAANDFQNNLGLYGEWKLTSFNNNFRNVYGQVGFIYDRELDQFTDPNIN